MDQRRADQPWHEGGILNRIPEPPAAPAELVVRPPAAERYADRLENPREQGPRPRPLRPGLVEPSLEHRRASKSERHGESDIAGVEHRRMNRERKVLQHRIQIRAVLRRGHQPLKRIRGPQSEQHETAADEAHHAEHAARKAQRQLAAEGRDRHAPNRQNQNPQEQRALVRAPEGRNSIEQRQMRVGITRDVQHGKIVVHERIDEAREGHHDEHELPRHGGTRHAHPYRLVRATRRPSRKTPATGSARRRV